MEGLRKVLGEGGWNEFRRCGIGWMEWKRNQWGEEGFQVAASRNCAYFSTFIFLLQ